MRLISAASALLLAYLVWGSREWLLIHDAPLMHYVAWLIDQGAVPYRDVFDMNLPGTYLLHLAVLRLGGSGDWAWRLFDLGWLAATCVVLFVYCRRIADGWAAAAAALLFGLYHLSGGAARAGQRDFLLCLFLLVGAWGVARGTEQGALGSLVWAGMALGAAMMLKPHAALYWLLCVLLVARDRPRTSSALRAAAIVISASLILPASIFGWLAWRGGSGSFLEVMTGYVLPLYRDAGRVPVLDAVSGLLLASPLWGLLLALGLLALLAAPPREPARKVVACVGLLYGVVHFLVQGKGWEYQLYPLVLFCCVLAATAVGRGEQGGWPRLADLFGARRPLALALWAVLVTVVGAEGVKAMDPAWIAEKGERVAAITRDLAPLVPRGATVQVMDTTGGGIHALLRLGLRQPTRFIYDFHFFHDVDDPRIRSLRASFLAELTAAPPAAILLLEDSWPLPAGYGRLDSFPEVPRLLETSYVFAVDGVGYRIYAKRSDS